MHNDDRGTSLLECPRADKSVCPTGNTGGAGAQFVLESRFGLVLVEFQDDAVRRISITAGVDDVLPPARERSAVERETLGLLRAYLAGDRVSFDEVPLDLAGQPEFFQRVQRECRRIPYGQTVSYAELARRAGRPKAVRAVGSAMSHNPIAIIVPCHRVLRSDGGLGGYSAPGGVSIKRLLLEMEGRAVR